ncbi:unnamed protein product [Ostreobium quekettii]|uniref:Uncharacterized protein n=1 Tax=Ostreobium quekettii TaxID=121088 RepID=A0A8S1J8M0_9CHLO|nr:unnamed protein product [Ostreobium quekettii]|eukprot:evm.model.scf_58.14 EVM.evm.TU.scf_58.14   scf_58:124566-126861(+)
MYLAAIADSQPASSPQLMQANTLARARPSALAKAPPVATPSPPSLTTTPTASPPGTPHASPVASPTLHPSHQETATRPAPQATMLTAQHHQQIPSVTAISHPLQNPVRPVAMGSQQGTTQLVSAASPQALPPSGLVNGGNVSSAAAAAQQFLAGGGQAAQVVVSTAGHGFLPAGTHLITPSVPDKPVLPKGNEGAAPAALPRLADGPQDGCTGQAVKKPRIEDHQHEGGK